MKKDVEELKADVDEDMEELIWQTVDVVSVGISIGDANAFAAAANPDDVEAKFELYSGIVGMVKSSRDLVQGFKGVLQGEDEEDNPVTAE